MTKAELAKQASEECNSPETTVPYGVKRGFPFWNIESTQFMYVPAFHFTAIRGFSRYRYSAVDEKGGVHTFEADDCCVLLTPIWAELPEGAVKLTVTALKPDGTDYAVVGARTFFRVAPFPGEAPAAVRSYKDAAIRAYRFAMSHPFVKHFLEHGTPDPGYDLNVYPSKMIAALIFAMLSYARVCPEDADAAIKIARNSADYLIGITPRGDVPLADLPPTYSFEYCPDPEKYGIVSPNFQIARMCAGTMMMIYPTRVAEAYLALEKATGETIYLEEALKIGKYYLNTVEPNGSWYLVRSCETGEPTSGNYISPLENVVPLLTALYKRTGDPAWKKLSDRCVGYAEKYQAATYNWEGQFEDSALSTNYRNLSHYGPVALAVYYCENHADDPERLRRAKELMRFVEDQFVVWKRAYPWPHQCPYGPIPYDTSKYNTPCALEQYTWYVPIDASACNVISGFLSLYKAGCGGLYLAKAKALADQLTRVQHENGQIPTHWMNTEGAEKNFWFNCMFESCRMLEIMSEYENVEP